MSQDMEMPLSNSESKKQNDFLKRINVTAVFGNVEKQWKNICFAGRFGMAKCKRYLFMIHGAGFNRTYQRITEGQRLGTPKMMPKARPHDSVKNGLLNLQGKSFFAL